MRLAIQFAPAEGGQRVGRAAASQSRRRAAGSRHLQAKALALTQGVRHHSVACRSCRSMQATMALVCLQNGGAFTVIRMSHDTGVLPTLFLQ